MSESPRFRQYRGDGTTRNGETVGTPAEEGCYLASPALVDAVNAMLAVERPLLVTGEPGTGKTVLAHSIAAELELGKVKVFTVRSDHRGRDLLYEFDNLQRFYDAQVQDPRARDLRNYLHLGPLGEAIQSNKRQVVLIDEIDKAPRDFPNDLLHVLDKMELLIPETETEINARDRPKPIVVITSNNESQLPEAFLRRCMFHNIEFPKEDELRKIFDQRLGHLKLSQELRDRIMHRFLEIRSYEDRLLKTPATDELLTWARILESAGVTTSDLDGPIEKLPFLGALLKVREDLKLFKTEVS